MTMIRRITKIGYTSGIQEGTPLFDTKSLKIRLSSLTPQQRKVIEDKLYFISEILNRDTRDKYTSWAAWMKNQHIERFDDSEDSNFIGDISFGPRLRDKYEPTLRLYIAAFIEAAVFNRFRFGGPFSSLYNLDKMKIVDSFDYFEEDPRLSYTKTADSNFMIDLREDLIPTFPWVAILNYLNGRTDVWPANICTIHDLIDFNCFKRISPCNKRGISEEELKRCSEQWPDMDKSLEFTMAALNLIDPHHIRTSFPSCRGHGALPKREPYIVIPNEGAPYLVIEYDFNSQAARILHHNLLTIQDICVIYGYYRDGASISYKLTRTPIADLDIEKIEKEAEKYARVWHEIARIINDFFTRQVITEDRMVSKDAILEH